MGRRRSFVRHIKRAGRRGIPFTRLVGSTVGMGLALAATSALAQAPAAQSKDTKDDVSLPGVDVRGEREQYKIEEPSLYRLPDPIKDTPQSITVLPEQILEQRSLYTLRDALRTVPGISLAAGEGGGRQGDNLTLRGFPAGTDIFIDGVRDLGQYARDTFNLESVEVLKGPSAVLFGRGSTGGIINQVSKSPRLTPFYELTGTVGSGPQGRVAVDLNQPFGPSAALRLNLMGFKGETPGRDHIEQERVGVAPSFGIGLNGPTRLIASYYYLYDDGTPDYGLPYVFGKPPDVDRENFYGFPDRDYEHDDVHIGTLAAFGKVVELYPGSFAAQRDLAGANEQLDRVDEAARAYEAALALRDQEEPRVRLAFMLLKAGRQPRALAQLQALADRDSKTPEVWSTLGRLAYEKSDLAGAEKSFTRAATLRDDGRTWFNVGVVRTRLNDLSGALQAYERAAQHGETREAAQKEVAKVREAMKGPATGTAPDQAMPGRVPGQPVPSRRY